jgi:hypothetical protein
VRDIDPETREFLNLCAAQARAELSWSLRQNVNRIRRDIGLQTVEQEQAEQIIAAVRQIGSALRVAFQKFAPAMKQLARMIDEYQQDQRAAEGAAEFSRNLPQSRLPRGHYPILAKPPTISDFPKGN